MIIFGWKNRIKIIAQGVFRCPGCAGEPRNGTLKQVKGWFTLFFIPIFPYADRGSFVQCNHCGNTYNPSVLDVEVTA